MKFQATLLATVALLATGLSAHHGRGHSDCNRDGKSHTRVIDQGWYTNDGGVASNDDYTSYEADDNQYADYDQPAQTGAPVTQAPVTQPPTQPPTQAPAQTQPTRRVSQGGINGGIGIRLPNLLDPLGVLNGVGLLGGGLLGGGVGQGLGVGVNVGANGQANGGYGGNGVAGAGYDVGSNGLGRSGGLLGGLLNGGRTNGGFQFGAGVNV